MTATVHYGFEPDPERAGQLDQAMHRELGASLGYVFERFNAHTPLPDLSLDPLLSRLATGQAHAPSLFGRYYDLVIDLLDGDLAQARTAFQRIGNEPPLPDGQRVEGLRPPSACATSRLYQDKMMAEMPTGLTLHPPPAELETAFVQRYHEGLGLLRQAAPELAGEVEAIVHHVVGVAGGDHDAGEFHGGSHFQLWGALFLNAGAHPDRIAMAEVIAHESAHSLLFGFCTEAPLVLNHDEELYPSPLRQDPRPMDGIYHATFVSARMHWAMGRLLDSGLLDEAERAGARQAMAEDAANFRAGHEVVAAHGLLSRHGRALMANAKAYMDHATG
ncbi:HEXXH motif domain-containing protein [Alkalilimnicola ehrlichii MLHE-1]|uniref:HEXXH motif domain-containing protein n=1 Tax=Alkalilimnicola ehrlichii (strain ATCC BAA-1101 / DSM 17681 / MLHE-1) TaxID=187272 RepID=Q0A633_ALKEH|nr:HEXXH motif domain-containing protein [Alkalilimnicola ehrlichii]ABI57704.1 hypothetical protein Mlg_2364 [Alkalilimnicola ehrlichii MLHE-1]